MSECSETISGVRAQGGELLHDDGVVEEVAAGAAVLDRLVGAEVPGRAAAPPGLAVAHAALVPLRHLGRDLLLGEAAELVAEELVLRGEDVSLHAGDST